MEVAAGTYAYGLNIVLPGTLNFIQINSKRVRRKFRLTSVQCALSGTGASDSFSYTTSAILGTEHQNWFGDFVILNNIFGEGALPHQLPGNGTIVEEGDFIVVQAKNLNTTAKWLAFLFQGEHI